jgi:hypothetical protein
MKTPWRKNYLEVVVVMIGNWVPKERPACTGVLSGIVLDRVVSVGMAIGVGTGLG